MKKNSKILLIIILFLLEFSCKKDKYTEFRTKELKEKKLSNGLPNITGIFNGYLYSEFDKVTRNPMGKPVPLEILDVTYNKTSGELTGKKILGDNSVYTGEISIQGIYNNTSFPIILYTNNIQHTQVTANPVNCIVINENQFFLYYDSSSLSYGNKVAVYIRRVDQ